MRWGDLQLLRSIDEMEQQSTYISNGLRLLQELAHGHGPAPRDPLPDAIYPWLHESLVDPQTWQ
jgi:hypothetical protein